MSLFGILTSLFGKESAQVPAFASRNFRRTPYSAPAGTPENVKRLLAKFDSIASLLITPTPSAIREASALIEEAGASLQHLAAPSHAGSNPQQLAALAQQLKELQSLAQGALRVQWNRMRTVKAITESYAPGGRVYCWQPAWPTVDLKV
jgi:hypothetical protein